MSIATVVELDLSHIFRLSRLRLAFFLDLPLSRFLFLFLDGLLFDGLLLLVIFGL